ncbi:MAG: PLP-dependent aminotransferase family protein [Thermomicrobiales bacterium]|nr:PLP-dependent aminotransferase family protein [Thermomicrobiales bacterium]
MAATVSPSRDYSSLLSLRGNNQGVSRTGDPRASANLISLIYGYPDAGSMPTTAVAEATTRVMETQGEWALQYGRTLGVLPMVDALIEKLARDNDITATRDEVMITAGGSQALALLLDLLVDRGDTIILEEPTWMGFIWMLKNVGGKAVSVPLDEQGMKLDILESKLKSLKAEGITPKFIYVIPNFQNPSGVSMPLDRRQRLIELANEYGTLIVEDDAYHDLRYSGETLPTIYSLDTTGSTFYTATLSKIMGAGMRIGWLVGPADLMAKLSVLKVDGSTNVFGSFVAAEWMRDNLAGHIEELKQVYASRRDAMLDALEANMPEGVSWTKPDGGFFVWVTVPEHLDLTALQPFAKERGVEYLAGSTCYVEGGKNTLRLSFSFATEDQIREGVRTLADIIAGELKESSL